MNLPSASKKSLDDALSHHQLRSTRQREHIFSVLMQHNDHPTADEVYARAKEAMHNISLATVYNCLETLASCGLVKQVNVDREPTRYCNNLKPHAHFHCQKTHRVYDIDINASVIEELKNALPKGYKAGKIEISFHGESTRAHIQD